MKNTIYTFTILLVFSSLVSCKKASLKNKFKGEWDVVSTNLRQWGNNQCGNGDGEILNITTTNDSTDLGNYYFSGDEYDDGSSRKSYSGTYSRGSTNYDFEYRVYKGDDSWYIEIEAIDSYQFEMWPISDLSKKEFTSVESEAFDCYNQETTIKMVKK